MDRNADRYDEGATARGGDEESPRIAALGELDDFQVAEGYPDVRGWDVLGTDGTKVGTVHELIVDTGSMRTRYLDVKLDRDGVGLEEDRDVLVPVGALRVDETSDHIVLDANIVSRLATLPAYGHDAVTRDYEDTLLPAFGATAAGAGADYYAGQQFDDSQFYAGRGRRAGTSTTDETRVTRSEEELVLGKRQVQAGEVNVRKTVESEHVSEPVTTRREEVTIERRPVTARSARAEIGEDEIRVPIVTEEAVIEKRPVVKEEVVIRKHAVEETQRVEADLRKERIDIDRDGERGMR